MIQLEITAEEYEATQEIAPDYIHIIRELVNYKMIGRVYVPDSVINESVKFIPMGKIIGMSKFKSDDPQVEYLKEIYRKVKYVTFEFHSLAALNVHHLFKLKELANGNKFSIDQLHVKDVTGWCNDYFNVLLDRQRKYEEEHLKNQGAVLETNFKKPITTVA